MKWEMYITFPYSFPIYFETRIIRIMNYIIWKDRSNLRQNGGKMSRIIIFTGKGGVGKTSIAAAHARKASIMGKKALLVSADMAHNLSDLFETPIGRNVTEITKNLYALEIDPYYEMEHDFRSILNAFEKFLQSQKKEGADEDIGDISILPGIEELFSLLKIQELYESKSYDLIIVDCAPTGETLSLLKFPELFSWYMEKMFPIGKLAMKLLRPLGKTLFKIELPDGRAMNDIEKLYVKLIELQTLFKNHETTSVRLVCMPEKMVVEETKRNYMYLNLYDYHVDGVFINRILPDEIDTVFFKEWIELQKKYTEELEMVFGSIPIYYIKWYDIDINGIESLDRIVKDVMTEDTLFDVRTDKPNEVYEKNENGYLLKVNIPCVKKEEIKLHEADKDIIIRIGNFKRCIPLPDSLRNHTVESAKMEEDVLNIQLIGKEREVSL